MSDLDPERFFVALSDDAPCGEDLEYDPAFTTLAIAAEGKAEQQIGDTVKEAEPPNWPAVRKDAIELLGRTRDLRIVLILTEASLHLDGIRGFHQGLRLFSGLLEQFWEFVHPQLDPSDDNDPTERINILNGLCDFDKMIRPLHRVPLIEAKGFGGFGLRDIQIASGRITAPEEAEFPSLNEIEAVFRDCQPEYLNAIMDAVGGCQEELEKIETAFSSRLGPQDSPDFSELQALLKEMGLVISQHSGVGPGGNEGTEGDVTQTGQITSGATLPSERPGGIQGPQDVVRVLDQVCEYYRKNEPSSPIPILLNRAKKLVSKDFMEIMKDLAPDGVSQVEMFRGTEDE